MEKYKQQLQLIQVRTSLSKQISMISSAAIFASGHDISSREGSRSKYDEWLPLANQWRSTEIDRPIAETDASR